MGFIDTGVDSAFLTREWQRAKRGDLTPDCHTGCAGCGLACATDRSAAKSTLPVSLREQRTGDSGEPEPNSYITYTLRYAKSGDARYIGHLDAMSLLVRALKAAGIRLKMHGRYHPKPRMALSPALPVGIESACELLEVEAMPIQNPDSVLRNITQSLPAGMRALELKPISMKEMLSGFQYILVGNGVRPEGSGLWKSRDDRVFYLWNGSNVKELWMSGSLNGS